MRSWRVRIAVPILELKDFKKLIQRLDNLLNKYMEIKK